MGLFGNLEQGAMTGMASTTPDALLGVDGGFSLGGAATGMVGGAVEGGMRDLLGMDPAEPCPATSGKGGSSSGAANDPCGQNDDPLKSAMLGLGMALAGPSIAAAGAALGGMLGGGLGAVSSTLGEGLSAVTGGLGGAMGLDPDSPAQHTLGSALGAGSMVALGGGNTTDQGIGLLGGATQAVSDTNSSDNSTGYFDAVKTTPGLN